MSKPFPIPEISLKRHLAVLGMTGSGKSSTTKLVIEHVVDTGARCCILDTVKSDHWGLTSSASGKSAGLPFQILGGDHGHVGLHPQAGKAIAELVASGALPLSILDMSEFGPGGLQHFFNDFAPTLLRKMRGVLYLPIEEAHELCPKEKSGVAGESMSVYYAKKLATQGRSKGIRLIVATQRVQALHNAVLGSCSTLIVHRMTMPADQEPVTKWLKGAIKDKGKRDEIDSSIPELADGEGWICSGVAKLLARVQFPRIRTFDNSQTPEDDAEARSVVTAKIDATRLRELVGTAVAEAEANDPKQLRRQIELLHVELADARRQADAGPRPEDLAAARAEGEAGIGAAVTAARRAALREGIDLGRETLLPASRDAATGLSYLAEALQNSADRCKDAAQALTAAIAAPVPELMPEPPISYPAPRGEVLTTGRHDVRPPGAPRYEYERHLDLRPPAGHAAPAAPDAPAGLSPGEVKILSACLEYPAGLRNEQLTQFAGLKRSTRDLYVQKLGRRGFVERQGELVVATAAGRAALPHWKPLPKGEALREIWRKRLSGGELQIFDYLCNTCAGASIERERLGEMVGLKRSTRDLYLQRLARRVLVENDGRSKVRAHPNLFAR